MTCQPLFAAAVLAVAAVGCADAGGSDVDTAAPEVIESDAMMVGQPTRVSIPSNGVGTMAFTIDRPTDVVISSNTGAFTPLFTVRGPSGYGVPITQEYRSHSTWEFGRASLSTPGRYEINLAKSNASLETFASITVHGQPTSLGRPALIVPEGEYTVKARIVDGRREMVTPHRFVLRHVSACAGGQERQKQLEADSARRENRPVMPVLDGYCVSFPDGRLDAWTLNDAATFDMPITALRTQAVVGGKNSATGEDRVVSIGGELLRGTPLTTLRVQHHGLYGLDIKEYTIEVARTGNVR